MAPATDSRRWTFTASTPLGQTRSSYRITDDALIFESDDVLGGGSQTVRWESIRQGATATMAGMGGRGGPDLPNWVPARIEWLIVSLTDKGATGFMRQLPEGDDRDAIVEAVRTRLGDRWIGEGVPIQDAQKRLGIKSNEWSTAKVAGLVVAVIALLLLSIILLAFLLSPIVAIPGGLVLGGWLLRRGREGYRASITAASTAADKIGTATAGLVHFEGRALTSAPTRAAVTGRPGVWWDVAVSLWYEGSQGDHVGEWRQVATRYGGVIDVLELEDDTGRIPVWLKDADLLLERRTWESHKDALPPQGVALLDELGFPWNGQQRIQVTEECLDANALLYVVGTLDERRNLPESGEATWMERTKHSIRTGEWRRDVVGAAPPRFRVVLAVFIGFLDMFTRIGIAKTRSWQTTLAAPPSIASNARVVWKGRGGRPLLVSDRPERTALASLRQRSLIVGGIGVAILCYSLYSIVEVLRGG